MPYTVHATKKLLDRVKQPLAAPSLPTSVLGNWYANLLFWRPQVVVFVSEHTLLPVFVPYSPGATLVERLPTAVGEVLEAHDLSAWFIQSEIAAMDKGHYDKTRSRSILGSMNSYADTADWLYHNRDIRDLVELSLHTSKMPMGALEYASADQELHLAERAWLALLS